MSTLTSYLEQREQLHARLADQAPAAPTMQHCGGADLTAALHR